MSYVDFKKWPCHRVKFKGQYPLRYSLSCSYRGGGKGPLGKEVISLGLRLLWGSRTVVGMAFDP